MGIVNYAFRLSWTFAEPLLISRSSIFIQIYPKFIQFVLGQCPLVLQLLVLIRLIFFKLSCWQTGKLAHCADHAHGEETQCHIVNYIFSRTWQTDWYSNNYYCHVYLSWYTWAGTYDSRCTLRGGPLEKWCGGGTFSTCTNIFFNFLLVSTIF